MSTPVGSSSFRLAWGNYCFDPDLTTSLAGYAFVAPSHSDVDNLLTPQLSDRGTASGTGLAGFEWIGDTSAYGGEFPIDVVGLLNFQATIAAAGATEWRVIITDAADSPVHTSDWTPLVPPPTDGFGPDQFYFLPETVMGSKVRWLFNQPSSGTTIVTAGAAWVSALWTTQRGIEDGFVYDPIDGGQMGLSKGRQGYPDEGVRGQALEFKLARFSLIEAFGDPADPTFVDVQKLQHRVGKTGFVIAWARTQLNGVLSPHLIHRMGVYGAFTQLGSITHAKGDDYTCGTMRVESLR